MSIMGGYLEYRGGEYLEYRRGDILSTVWGIQYRRGYHEYCGGYLEYRGGYSVPWGIS